MKNRDQILKEITESSLYLSICRNIARTDLAEDLHQEFLMALLTYPNLEEVYEKEWFVYFCTRIITNLYYSTTSTFYLSYRLNDAQTKYLPHQKFDIPDETDHLVDEMLDGAITEMEKLDWYDRELYKAYLQSRGSMSLARKTRINQGRISNTVAKVKAQIQNSKPVKECLT